MDRMKPSHRQVTSRISLLLYLAALLLVVDTGSRALEARDPSQLLVYVGTYTGPKSKGIYFFRLDLASGKTTAPEVACETESPSFLAIHPSHRFLYAVNEVSQFRGAKWGSVSAFSVDPGSGKLTLLNQELSGGTSPCHLTVDRAGRNVLVANYGSGSAALLPIEENGRLKLPRMVFTHAGTSVNPGRQEGPHAHSINLDAQNRHAFVADLGIDRVMVYHYVAETGTLIPRDLEGVAVKPGSGPRHFAFHPGGRFAYVINELQCTVTAFSYDPEKGDLKEIQTLSTLPGKLEGGFSTAEVQVHPSGKFLYGSNRGHHSIAVFSIDPVKGTLAPVEHQPTRGKTPRNFGIDPTGAYLLAANQDSGTIVMFRIDASTGRLSAASQVIEVPSPVCVKFLALE